MSLLRQRLPCIALFLYRFDDCEEKFDQANDHTLITTEKVPAWVMKIAIAVKYGKVQSCSQGRTRKRVDETWRFRTSRSSRKAYLNLQGIIFKG